MAWVAIVRAVADEPLLPELKFLSKTGDQAESDSAEWQQHRAAGAGREARGVNGSDTQSGGMSMQPNRTPWRCLAAACPLLPSIIFICDMPSGYQS